MGKSKAKPKQGKNREVGPGKPPVEHQFTPGQSGNPNGRPKTKPVTDALKELLHGETTIRIGGHERTISTIEALAQVAINQALKGDMRWWIELMDRTEGKVADVLQAQIETPQCIRDFEQLPDDVRKAVAEASGGPTE